MRYFCYNEYDPEHIHADYQGNVVITLSEDEIKEKYWPYWYERMCKKYGKYQVDKKYCFEDCLSDWILTNWAWENN